MPANRCPNPTCEYFNRTLPNNAKLCPWCSTPLGNIIPSTPNNPPAPQPFQQPPPQQQPVNQPTPDYSTQYQQRAYIPPIPQAPIQSPRLPVLKLIHSTGREFILPGEGGSIGRRTQSMPNPPEIDLTGIPHEGIVSRRHARVFWDWSQNAYMIIDTSTNGMCLNGNLLSSSVSYRLLNGDILQLGYDNLVVFTLAIT